MMVSFTLEASQPCGKTFRLWLAVRFGFDDRPYHSADLKEGASWKRGALFIFRTLHPPSTIGINPDIHFSAN